MATLYYKWMDLDGDAGYLEYNAVGYEVATFYVNDEAGVHLTRPQAKKLRKALKRALASDLP